jgi:hypothetical protein
MKTFQTLAHCLLLVVCSSTFCFAQNPANETSDVPTTSSGSIVWAKQHELVHGIGLQIGLATGSGISYRLMMPSRLTFEATALYFALNSTFSNIGAEAQYDFSMLENSRFYGLAGGAYVFSSNASGGNGLGQPLRFGAGVGYETFLSHFASVGVELPISVWVASGNTIVIPTPQVHFMYHFQ